MPGTVERLERILAEAHARQLRVVALKVSRIEHAELCRLALVPKGSCIQFGDAFLQVVSE